MPNIVCAGPHQAPVVLGTTSGTAPTGYLCTDCQTAYAQLVPAGRLAMGAVPTRAQVDSALASLGATRQHP